MASSVSLRSGGSGGTSFPFAGIGLATPPRSRLPSGQLLRSGAEKLPRDTVVVLVVEDVPQVRATAVRIMEDLGCEVFDAYNGRDALKLLRAHPGIEVLFADVRMPGMSGTELAEA